MVIRLEILGGPGSSWVAVEAFHMARPPMARAEMGNVGGGLAVGRGGVGREARQQRRIRVVLFKHLGAVASQWWWWWWWWGAEGRQCWGAAEPMGHAKLNGCLGSTRGVWESQNVSRWQQAA